LRAGWVNGNQIGAKFITQPDKKKHAERAKNPRFEAAMKEAAN
jgi:hypothetical protein